MGTPGLVFNSLKFALFLPIVLVLYWLSPARWRKGILLISSYVFYMAWRPVYLLLILGLTAINYWFGLRIANSEKRKKAWLVSAIVANLGTLAYFKYLNLLQDTLAFMLQPWFGHGNMVAANVILPLGISFFVFEFIHYIVDVYKGSEPVRNIFSFALFPSFFPTQIAGPIKRYQDFIPQLNEQKTLSIKDFDQGMFLIITGLFKKVLLADNLSLFISGGYLNPENFTGIDMWLFTSAFLFQVYFDFGGYADIARGAAKLFGFNVPINFDFPLLSGSMGEFWRRWHITLGTWLRDYLYIPLGGSRHGRLKAARNLLITWALGGLWHGAEFHYLIWGIYQGVCLALHREFRLFRESSPKAFAFLDTFIGHRLSIAITFAVLTLGMSFFRAQSVAQALLICQKMCFLDLASDATKGYSCLLQINYPLIFPSIFLLLPAILVGQSVLNRIKNGGMLDNSPRYLKIGYAVCAMVLISALCSDNSPRFVYYQF